MTSRLARLCLALAASSAAVTALAQPAPLPPAPGQAAPAQPAAAAAAPGLAGSFTGAEEMVQQLVLADADIDTVISLIEQYTNRIAIRPQQLTTANYNLKIRKPVPKAEAIIALETSLALNGIGLAPLGDRFIKIVNLQQVAKEAPEMITGSTLDIPASGKPAVKLFQLEFLRVSEFLPMVQAGILSQFYGAPVQLQNANALMITDSVSNLQRVELLLRDVDKPIAGMTPKFYTLKNGAKASDLVGKLRAILGTPVMTQQLGTATAYSADDRTNQIILITDPRQYPLFDDLINRLDQKSDPNTRTEVIYLKNAKAKDVVDVVNKIITGSTTALQKQNPGGPAVRPTGPQTPQPVAPAPGQPAVAGAASPDTAASNEFSSLMTVINDERSNAVVVFGTADDIRLVRDLISRLDITLAQVRIEVVIAEVTLDDNDESGISALGLKMDKDKLVGVSGSTIGATVSNGILTRPGSTGHFDLAAELAVATSLRKRNNAIITVPAVVTSHGKEAKFFNGETRPVVTGTIQSAAGATTGLASSSTVTQQQIGTTLTVTPFIGSDGSVQLDMKMDVQDVIGEVKVDANAQYIIGQRQTTTYNTSKSGDILVLGGSRKTTSVKENYRLGPIPIIGDLFGTRKRTNNRQELIFFVRPIVLTNNPAVDNADALKRVDTMSTKDAIRTELDPNYKAPEKSALDRLLGK